MSSVTDYKKWDKFVDDQSDVSSEEDKEVVKSYKIDWDQTDDGISIDIDLFPGEAFKENIEVLVKSEFLFVKLKTSTTPIISGRTWHQLRPDECNWWISEQQLHLELEKGLERVVWEEVMYTGATSRVIDAEEERKARLRKEAAEKEEIELKRRAKVAASASTDAASDKDAAKASTPPAPAASRREKHLAEPGEEWLFECD